MPDILPIGKLPIVRINPKITMLYGPSKIGKTEQLSLLENCKTLATEPGCEMYNMDYLRITSVSKGTSYFTDRDEEVKLAPSMLGRIKSTSIDNFIQMMEAEGKRQLDAKEPLHFPYKYLAVDTVDELETMCEVSATGKYKLSVIGKTFEGNSVLELAKGGGYYHLRNEVKLQIEKLAAYCRYLILTAHVRDSVIDKGDIQVEVRNLSLTGQLGKIVCAACDIIGYLFREQGKPLMVSFETYDRAAMGARFKRLAGKTMPFSWDTLFIEEPVKQS